MIQKLKDLWVQASTSGLLIPFVKDPVNQQPSVTLLMVLTSFLMTVVSLVALHLKADLLIATGTTMLFWIIGMVFYLIRNIQRAKFDLDDKSFDIEGDKEDEEKK